MMVNSLIDATLREIALTYRPGTLAWMKSNRPKEWRKMLALEGGVNEMALKSNLKGLRGVLNEYQGLILSMVKELIATKEEKGQDGRSSTLNT